MRERTFVKKTNVKFPRAFACKFFRILSRNSIRIFVKEIQDVAANHKFLKVQEFVYLVSVSLRSLIRSHYFTVTQFRVLNHTPIPRPYIIIIIARISRAIGKQHATLSISHNVYVLPILSLLPFPLMEKYHVFYLHRDVSFSGDQSDR